MRGCTSTHVELSSYVLCVSFLLKLTSLELTTEVYGQLWSVLNSFSCCGPIGCFLIAIFFLCCLLWACCWYCIVHNNKQTLSYFLGIIRTESSGQTIQLPNINIPPRVHIILHVFSSHIVSTAWWITAIVACTLCWPTSKLSPTI